MAMVQLRSREGGGLGAVPQTRNKIEIMPHQKIALVDFSYFTEAIQMTLLCFKMAIIFFKKKLLRYIFRGSHVNMCIANKFFFVVRFTIARKLIFLYLL